MAPEPVTFPHRRFVVTRLDAGVETTVISSTPLANNYTTDQGFRKQVFDNAKTVLDANPGVVFLVYGPTNGGDHTNADLIWDSRINEFPNY